MVDNITNELLYETLKAIRADIGSIKSTLADHGRQLIEVRRQLNSMQAEIIRSDEHMLGLDARLDRIERRLELSDAE